MKDKLFLIIILIILSLFSLSISSCNTIGALLRGDDVTVWDVTEDVIDTVNISADVKAAMRNDFTSKDRYYVGRATSAYVFSKYEILEDYNLTEYLNQVGSTVALASKMSTTYNGYRFVAFEDENPNAYATPGGMILISTGMLRMCNNEDELAAVFAHEIEHIVKDHPMDAVNKDTKKRALIAIAKFYLAKGAEETTSIDPNIINAMVDVMGDMASDIADVLDNGYERDTEYEADKGAVMTLHVAGYSVNALKSIITKLPYDEEDSIYGSNHPSPDDRIKAIDEYIAEIGIEPHMINVDRAFRFTQVMIEAGIVGE
jgi:beta-barrel assembly-enhancing protease